MIDAKIRTLLAVAGSGSYTRAAEQLCLTQPAVSHHIHQLEEEYGIKIFFRDKSYTDFLIILAPLRKCRNCLEYQAFPAFCVSEDTPHIMAYRSLIWRSKVVKP